ncbi:MAG: hypothetical protein AAF289_08005 [Cyanobacteria bacterium P01_A01_bin.135]
MARYIGSCKAVTSLKGIRHLITDVLRACDFNLVYEKDDYFFAKELPGNVNFSKLVTVEVLIDNYSRLSRAAEHPELEMSFVLKNEELPLKLDNHCRRKFDRVRQAIADSDELELVDAA